MANNSTLLSIVGIDLSDYASRDLTLSLNPIVTGALERDVNGNLVDMTLESHRKYAAVVTCTDHEAPELTGVWRGLEVTVTLIPGLGVVEGSGDDPITLEMMVDSWKTDRREWRAETAWSLTLVQK